MKATTKIFFGAAISAAGLAALSPQAYAAQINNLDSTAKILVTADGAQNPKIQVSHLFRRADINFTINQAVAAGDHIEFSTHAIPVFDNQDIYSDNAKSLVIGRLELVETINGSLSYQVSENGRFASSKPTDQEQRRYRITLNESAAKLDNLSFGIGQFGRSIGYSIATEDYLSTAWIKVNNVTKASADFTVSKFNKYIPRNNLWIHEVSVNADNNQVCMTVGYNFAQNTDGGKITYATKSNPYIKFISQEGSSRGMTVTSNFIYTDNSKVNQHGLILKDDIGQITHTLRSQTDTEISYDITMRSNYFSAGIGCINVELTDEGKKYIAQNGTLPTIDLDVKITQRDGSVVWNGVSSRKMTMRGSSANFLSKIREEVEEMPDEELKDEQKTQDAPQETPEVKPEIQAPDTGFEGNILPILVSSASILGILSLTILKKRV